MYDPTQDGIDHINIYSKAQTRLGRELSHFAHSPILIPEHGQFASVEGYWYWLSCQRDELRELHGLEAKKQGRVFRAENKMLPITHPDKKPTQLGDFNRLIMQANRIKIDTYPDIKQRLVESSLPIAHYFVNHRNGTTTIQMSDDGAWIWNDIARYRAELKGEPEPVFANEQKIKVDEEQFSLF